MSSTVLVALVVSLTGCLGPALWIEPIGDGSGTITSEPEGIDCGDTCAMVMPAGPVTITATPAAGSRFLGWGGDLCTGTEACVVTLTADATIEAMFELQRFELSVTHLGDGTGTIDGAGIACGDDCSETHAYGTPIAIAATAAPGSTFAGWSGACTGTTPACITTILGATTATATFVLDQQLLVTRDGDGAGTVRSTPAGIDCGPTCAHAFPGSSVVSLSAVPAAGSMFAGWSGACSGSGACSITLDNEALVTATFTRIQANACTTTVSASEPATAFNTRLASSGAVVCLAPGIAITGAVSIGASNVTIRGLAGTPKPRIVNLVGDALDTKSFDNIKLEQLDIESRGQQLHSAIVATSTSGLEIRSSTVQCHANNCYIVKATNGSSLTIADSTLLGGTATTNYSYGVYGWVSASVTITNSHITSHGNALNVTVGSNFVVSGSTLTGTNPFVGNNNATITVYNSNASLQLTSSTVTTNGFDALSAGGAASGVTVTLNGNTFRKRAGLPAGSYSPLTSARADDVFLSTVANTFCNEGTATDDAEFATPLISGPIAASSTFQSIAHIGPTTCAP